MRCVTADSKGVVCEGIVVMPNPYPHIVLGEGGHKRSTWVAIGARDAASLVVVRERGGRDESVILDAGVIALKDKSGQRDGRHLLVAPRAQDDRVLVFWSVSSGYRGGADIIPGDDVQMVASDESYHSGRGALGSTAEMLAILKPGQSLYATRSGRRLQETRGILSYDGHELKVVFGGDELMIATGAKEPEGDVL